MPDVTVDIELLPKQKAFVLAGAKQCLYSGAFGAGKSYALCAKTVLRAQHKQAREALTRKHLNHLRGTTLRTLLSGDGDTPPVLPEGSYRHYKADHIIALHGGGEIVYFSLEDTTTIGSYNLTGAGVDQAEELTDDDWHFLLGRIRATGEGINRQLYAVCNPDSPSHHLARRFGLSPDVLSPEPGCWVICTRSIDNPHLPEDYVKVLQSFTGVRKKRFVDGVWAGSEGLIYDNWDREKHVVDRRIPPSKVTRVIIGVDDGTTVPFSCLRIVKDSEGKKHVDRMEYGRNMREHEKIEAIMSLAPFDVVVVDPAAAALKLALRAEGWDVRDANNDVIAGIQEVQTLLCLSPDGTPWLTISPSCTDLVREMETYEWAKKKGDKDSKIIADKPVKENDHAADALRYGCMEDKMPVSAAVDTTATTTLARTLPEETSPRFVGSIDPVVGWCVESENLIRKAKHEAIEFVADAEGLWRLWCELPGGRPDQNRPWVLAVSCGTGAPGSMSVLKVGDAELKTVLGECVLMNMSPENVARVAVAAGLWFGGVEKAARLIWQHAGGGISFTDTVRRLRYPNVYRHVEEGVAGEEPGWRWSPAGIASLLGHLQAEIKAGRYKDVSRETVNDLRRWAFKTDGTVGPISTNTESEPPKNASDRALAAMLMCHAFSWVSRLNPIKRKIVVGSLEWLEKHEKERRRKSPRSRRV